MDSLLIFLMVMATLTLLYILLCLAFVLVTHGSSMSVFYFGY